MLSKNKTFCARNLGLSVLALPTLIAASSYAYPWTRDVRVSGGLIIISFLFVWMNGLLRQFFIHYKWLGPSLGGLAVFSICTPFVLVTYSSNPAAILAAETIPLLAWLIGICVCAFTFKATILQSYGWHCGG